MPAVDLAIPAFGYKNHFSIDRRFWPIWRSVAPSCARMLSFKTERITRKPIRQIPFQRLRSIPNPLSRDMLQPILHRNKRLVPVMIFGPLEPNRVRVLQEGYFT